MICLPQEQRSLQYLLNFLWKSGTKPISDSLSQIEGRSGIVKIFEKDAKFSEKIVRCKVGGKQLRFQAALQTKFFKIERRNIMITYHNHPHMTAVPTRRLLDTNLSAEAKLTGALLYTFEDGGLSAQELADVLGLPPEKVAPVFAELTGNGYLEILEENGAFGLHLKG